MRLGQQQAAVECFAGLPLPVLVLSAAGEVIYENPAYRSKFRAGTEVAAELALALPPGRSSSVRAAIRGAARVLPLGSIGGVPREAHYFPIACGSGERTLVGVLFVELREALPPQLPDLGGGSTEVEQSLRFILDGMPQLVWSALPDGYHDFYNRRWCEYTGMAVGQSQGAGWNDALHPDDQQSSWERWRRSLETGEDYEIEYRFRGVDGVYRWFLGRAVPMRDKTGRIVRWFGTCTDIDEQKRLERARAEVLAQIEANSRLKDEFLATVSHELRTPLTAILGWARMQRSRPELVPKALQVIERNAEAQAKLIEEILETSRVVTGKIRLIRRRVDLNDLVHAAVDAIRPAADAKSIAISASLDARMPKVCCDPDRLLQVLSNLLTNAVKFTSSGGRVVVLTEAHAAREASITVADTGKGIAASFLPYVFERFRQAEGATTRRNGGLGLGLAIVKHLVELHGGCVSVASDGDGRGATFVVRLPVDAAPSHAHADRAALDRMMGRRAARLDGVRVLVVDDEPDARELVAMVLRDAGAQTREVCSASSALEAMSREPCDVLISDIGMPLRDGYSLLREIRSLAPDRGGAVPAVALTAFTRTEDVDRAIEAGFQLHLAKPVEPSELVAAVHALARCDEGHGPS